MDDDEWDANSMTSLMEDANPSSQPFTPPADSDPNLDVIQRLDLMRSDFATKLDGVLNAIHDVKRDVRDFAGRMDEAEERISKVEDVVDSGKGKTEELIKQVEQLTYKLDDLENRSRRSNICLKKLMQSLFLRSGYLKLWVRLHFPRHLSLRERTGFPRGHKTPDLPDREPS